jgi:hypothetical protein
MADNASEPTKPSALDRVIEPWWAKLLIAAFMFFIAWSTYVDFTKLESGEIEKLSIGRSTRMLYKAGGKPLAVGSTIVVGVGFAAWGAVQVSRGKKQ